ncbi:MAG TPA: proline--tRNA ligase [Desulfomonilia bacterium]
MKFSGMFLKTMKEDPRDAEVASHRLMLRAGMIKKLASGIYSWLPYGLLALKKVEKIIREEMNAAGAQEVLMPGVQPCEIWQESGRWDIYGKELLRFKDRKNAEFCLGPTHEEVITDMVRSELNSYKDLPVTLYQIQAKFRDEIRPRFGVMRAREFMMKDAYSFDKDDEGAEKSYESQYKAYEKIFERCGLRFKAVEADSGPIGGNFSHEFMVLADTGEDIILSCTQCSYAANVEKAEIKRPEKEQHAEVTGNSPEKVHTPDIRTVEEVCEFLGIEKTSLVKTMIYNTDKGLAAALVRGDHEVNEAKLRCSLGVDNIELADEEMIARATGAPRGFAGPVGLKVRIVADISLDDGPYVTGANEHDYHLKNVWLSRDAKIEKSDDIRNALPGDACPKCSGILEAIRGIEVGHVFKLGTKYSKTMHAEFLDEKGDLKPMIMGCYGIGVSRVVAAAIEQNHDGDGIIFPLPIAPFAVIILPLDLRNPQVVATAEDLYSALTKTGLDVLIDDRDLRPGFKFKDADLIGIPYRVTIGSKGLAEGLIEIRERATGNVTKVSPAETLETLAQMLKEKGMIIDGKN